VSAFERAVVIFNPNSTGDAPSLAEQFRDELAQRVPDLPVELAPTERAGHAQELARDAAASGRPLIVSVSGDGGYNEVVNGVMDAGNRDAVAAVIGAGNANDHRRVTRQRPLAEAVEAADVQRMDLLKLSTDGLTRYAHSYIGLGITPVVAVDLEKGGKGSFREISTVIRAFARFRPFAIELEDGRTQRFDSLIFANIRQMAKYATLSEDGAPDDGVFEVITLKHTAKWRVLFTAVKAAARGLGEQPTARHYRFTTTKPLPLQLDGELVTLEPGTRVSVDLVPGALAIIR
jgi:diacylglycerol kinase family enzyme